MAIATGAGIKPMVDGRQATVESYDIRLAFKQDNIRHTHTRYEPYASPCAPVAGGLTSGYATRIEVPGVGGDKETNSNAIDVSGKITLPSADKTSAGPK